MGKGVRCPSCGGSTPLPDDLRVPTFACAFCRAPLETAAFAGKGQVSAEGLARHLEGLLDMTASDAMAGAQTLTPLEDRNLATRDASCLLCGGAVRVPLALEEKVFACDACGREQAIARYVSDEERMRLDLDRQVAENESLDRLIATGVACGRCGGHDPVPDDGTPQFLCSHCGTTILLVQYVAPGALARRRLRRAALGLRDEAVSRQNAAEARARRVPQMIVGLVLLGIAVAAVLALS